MLAKSFDYPYKDRLGPGPGFFPFWLSLITGVLALASVFQIGWTESPVDEQATLVPERSGARRILFVLAGLVGVVGLFNFLGFRISLFLFLVFLPLALGVRNWWFTAILAFAGSFGVFHVFYYWLKLPLPIGVFGI